jgi:hypothetical protein
MIIDVAYKAAETRGRLRQWKKKLARSYAEFDAAFQQLQGGKLCQLAGDMVNGARSTRKRAFEKIHKVLGPGVTLESVELGRGDRALAIWSILKPRHPVTVVESDGSSERESLLQD